MAFVLVLGLYASLAFIVGGAYRAGLPVDSATCFLPLLKSLPKGVIAAFPVVLTGIILANLTSWFISTIRVAKELSGGRLNEGLLLLNFILVLLHFMDKQFVNLSTLIAASNVGFLLIYGLVALAHFRWSKSWVTVFAMFAVCMLLSGAAPHWVSALPILALFCGFVKLETPLLVRLTHSVK